MKKNLMQRYGLLRQIPRKALTSSCSCCDNCLDFGQCLKTCFFFVARYHKNGSGSRCKHQGLVPVIHDRVRSVEGGVRREMMSEV